MASGVIGQMILFTATAMVVTVFVGIMAESVYSISSGIKTKEKVLVDEMTTDLEIVNDPRAVPYNSSTGVLIIYVKNTGTASISPSTLTLLVDGVVHTSMTAVPENGTEWDSYELLTITAQGVSLSSGDHRVTVLTDRGVSDSLSFRV